MMLSGMVNARYQVHPGDLIISRANTPELVGSACIVTESDFRLLLSDKTLRLVVNPKMADVRYVNACLSMPNVRAQIVNSASGSSLSMQNVNQRSIERLIIPKLNLSEQIKFADRIDSCDALIGEERRKLAKLRAVKRGLVDDLLASGGADQRSGL